MRRWFQEPFVHFVALGALTFGLHRVLQTREEQHLTVSSQVQRELTAAFEQRQRRMPSEAEHSALVERWVEDEILFREGVRLDLVHSDSELRAEIIARVRALLQASLPAQAPSEAELTAFYADHRADYAEPATTRFLEHVVRAGPDAEDRARSLLHALKALPPEADPAEMIHLPISHPSGSEAQLSALYGPELAHGIFGLELGVWRELRSARGIHLLKVEARSSAQAPGLSAVRSQVLSDYQIAQTQRGFKAELAKLQGQWRVDLEGAR